MNRRASLALFVASAGLAGCGAAGTLASSAAFHPSYPDNQASTLASVAARIGAAHGAPAPDVAVAVTADRAHVVGFDPATGASLYRLDLSTSVPVVATGAYLLVETADSLRVLDLQTGRGRASIDLGSGTRSYHLIGAHASGARLALSLSAGNGAQARSRLVIVDGDSVSEDLELDRPMGVPAVAGEQVLVPWAYQYLSVLDGHGGELARVRLRSSVVGHAIAEGGDVWFGGAALYRFGAASANDSPTGYSPPDLGVEHPPILLPNAYEAPAALTSAAYHVRLVFGLDPSRAEPAPADDLLYLVYYRLIFALDARTAEPRWVRSLPGDVIGASAFPGGVRIAAETGDLLTLAAADGRAYVQASVGEPLAFVGYPRLASLALGEAVEGERPDVRSQLLEAVQIGDARLVAPREFALARLASLADDGATADLGLLCEDARLPARTRQKACDLLAARPVGVEHVEAQLRRHGSFLEETPHPPVDALARAAATMHDAAAAPLLVQQLEDPQTPTRAIPSIASALVAIGDTSVAPALLTFLRTYHADTAEEGMSDAVGAVAGAYVRLGGSAATAELETIANDPLTSNGTLRAIREAMTRARLDASQASSAPVTASATTPAPVAPARRPVNVTHEMAAPVLDPLHEDLAACLRTDPARPGSARTILVLTREGSVAEVHSTPLSVEPCLTRILAPVLFPTTQGAGPTTRFTFTIPNH